MNEKDRSQEELLTKDANPSESRRDFIRGAAGVAGVVAAVAVSAPSNAAWPPGATPKYTGRGNVPDAYEMYTQSSFWSEEDVTQWEGRRISGVPIGIIQLSANIPMIPGNVGNATTFDYPVMYQHMEVTGEMVVSSEPHPEVTKRSIEAGRLLEAQGVRAIVGNCGFFANYQPLIAAELDVPFFGSSLLQIPLILQGLKPDQKVGVLTANGQVLAESPALANSGVVDESRVEIVGAEQLSQMKRILATEGAYNPRQFELELFDLAKVMVDKNPEIGAILLECTELAPHGRAVQKALGMPVWAFPDMIDWVHSGVVKHSWSGYI